MIRVDTSELNRLSVDLGRTGFRSTFAMFDAVELAGERLVKAWASNARRTSGTHGRHYPDSIDKEVKISTDIVVEVGPNPSKPQGGMSFEYGSVNQPPHLDGNQAADVEIPHLERDIMRRLAQLGL